MSIELRPRSFANLRPVARTQLSQELLASWHERGYPVCRSEVHIKYWLQIGTYHYPHYIHLYSHHHIHYYFDYRIANQDQYFIRDIYLEAAPWDDSYDYDEVVHGLQPQ